MTMLTKPNAWISVEEEQTTRLTYGARVYPTPLTVNAEGKNAVKGSVEVLITNGTADPLAVGSVAFTIVVGPPGEDGAPLTPSTAGMSATVSDAVTWKLSGPPPVPPIVHGTVTYALGPATGKSVTLDPGKSVSVQIYGFATVPDASTSTIVVKETIGGNAEFTSIEVSTFPAGFYFDSLTPTIRVNSDLVPVAQVGNGDTVTLTWNASVMDLVNQEVLYSSPASGQQRATPSELGTWTTPKGITDDTVFVVKLSARGVGGRTLTAALSTAVSVLKPEVVATSMTTGHATVNGPSTFTGPIGAAGISAAGISATGLTVTGNATATSATVNGELTTDAATVHKNLSAASANVTGNVGAGSVSAKAITATGSIDCKPASVTMFQGTEGIGAGKYQAHTDGFVVGSVIWPDGGPDAGCVGYVAAGFPGGAGVYATGGNLGAFGPRWTKAQAYNANSFVLPVPSGAIFDCSGWQTSQDLKQADARWSIWWMPIGASAGSLTRLGNASEDLLPEPEVAMRPEGERMALVETLVDTLEPLFAKPLEPEVRDRLVRTIGLL